MKSQFLRVGILVGEHSGDILGAALMNALRETVPGAEFYGIGGPRMIAAGFTSLHEMERLSVMGFVEPLRRLPELLRIRKQILQHFLHNKPDVFIGIDSPEFNLGIEVTLRTHGIPVLHYVSPSVWAWRQGRIHKIARAVDRMLTVFPFEADFYQRHSVPVSFVGHPLADQIPLETDRELARKQLGIDAGATCLAILPGSRAGEIRHLAPVFLAAAKLCQQKIPALRCLVPMANAARRHEFSVLKEQLAPELSCEIFDNAAREVMAAADVVLVTSGTATLEAMLLKRPMVIAFRMGRWSFRLAKYLVKVPFIGLPNLLAGELLVPEYIQDAATPEALADALLGILQQPEKIPLLQQKFLQLHETLRCDASRQAALAVMSVLAAADTKSRKF